MKRDTQGCGFYSRPRRCCLRDVLEAVQQMLKNMDVADEEEEVEDAERRTRLAVGAVTRGISGILMLIHYWR